MIIGPKQPDENIAAYYASTFAMQLLLCAVLAALIGAGSAILVLWFPSVVPASIILPLLLTVLFSQIQDYLRRYSFTVHSLTKPFLQDTTRYTVQLGLLWAASAGLFGWKLDVPSGLWICAVAAAVSSVLFWQSLPGWSVARGEVVKSAQRNLSFAGWQLGSALLQWLSSSILSLISGALLGVAAVGALRASQTLLGVTNIFFQAAENIVPQIASRRFVKSGKAGLRFLVWRLFIAGNVVTIAALLVLGIPGEAWLSTIFGPAYRGYGFVVSGLAVGLVLAGGAAPLRYALSTIEDARGIFLGYAVSALASVLSSYTLIATFGLYGALASFIASQAIMLAVFWVLARSVLKREEHPA